MPHTLFPLLLARALCGGGLPSAPLLAGGGHLQPPFACCSCGTSVWRVCGWGRGGDGSARGVGGRVGLGAPPATVLLLVAGCVAFAATDPVTQAFTTATMQSYYPTAPQLNCAVAAPKFFYALGFAGQQLLSLAAQWEAGRPCIAEQCGLLACLTLVSAASLYRLNRLAPIDGR